MSWLTALPTLITRLGGGTFTTTILNDVVPGVIGVLENFALKQFPTIPKTIRALVAAATTFNPNLGTWLQGFLNKELAGKIGPALKAAGLYRGPQDDQLTVDSVYGIRTTEAVKLLQRELGMPAEWVDGWFGSVTRDWVLEKMGVKDVPLVPVIIDPQSQSN